MDEYAEGAVLYLLDDAKEVTDVRNDAAEEAVVLEYDVSTERSEGAGMLLPPEKEECQPAAGDP